MTREIQWLRFRAFHGRKVPVETSVDGLHRVHAALEGGNGAILWGMSFCETLPKLIAFQRAGLPLVLLSSAYHGVPSDTRLGLEVVGPFFSAPENRFLAERLIVPADLSLGYLRQLQKRLSDNACVCIRGDLASRRANVRKTVFGVPMSFARGAPGLSWKLGSPLLPIHTVRDGPFRYRTIVHPPVEIDGGLDKDMFIEAALEHYVQLLKRCALEAPSNWEIWAGMV
jgi:hypothetical protein